MQVGVPLHAHFEYEVFEPGDPPKRGDVFLDPRGREWTVREVKDARGYLLRDPHPDHPGFRVTLEAKHGAYRIEPGEELTPKTGTRRSGPGWVGLVTLREAIPIGFGDVHCGGQKFSWYYRSLGGTWTLKIGKHVATDTYFEGGHLHFDGEDPDPKDTLAAWERIDKALTGFVSDVAVGIPGV
jgi:hypothetical protein